MKAERRSSESLGNFNRSKDVAKMDNKQTGELELRDRFDRSICNDDGRSRVVDGVSDKERMGVLCGLQDSS